MKAHVEFDTAGRMRIVVDGVKGEFADYHNIATLVRQSNKGHEETFIAVTDYGLGCPPLKPETVYQVTDCFVKEA